MVDARKGRAGQACDLPEVAFSDTRKVHVDTAFTKSKVLPDNRSVFAPTSGETLC
jgi:hypothetical protein